LIDDGLLKNFFALLISETLPSAMKIISSAKRFACFMLCVAHKNFIPEFAFFEIKFSNSVVALGSKLEVG